MTDKTEVQDGQTGSNEEVKLEGADLTQEQLIVMVNEAKAKADENWNQLLRSRAEMDNLRRRAERDVESAHRYALDKIAAELLPVRDGLELGLNAASTAGAETPKIIEGMDITLKMLRGLMEKFNITEVNPQNEKFNPALHQAMAAQDNAEVEPNTVLAVYQKGYLLNDRLLRPAMVVVSRGGAAKKQEQGLDAHNSQDQGSPGHIDRMA